MSSVQHNTQPLLDAIEDLQRQIETDQEALLVFEYEVEELQSLLKDLRARCVCGQLAREA